MKKGKIALVVICAGLAGSVFAREQAQKNRQPEPPNPVRERQPGRPEVDRGERERERQPARERIGDRMAAMQPGQMILNHLLRDPEIIRQSGISEEQLAALREGLQATEEVRRDLQAALRAAGLRQAGLIADPNSSEEDLMASVEELGRIRTEMARERIRGVLLVRDNLTPEQVEQAQKAIQARIQDRRRQAAAARGGADRPGRRVEGDDRPQARDRTRDDGERDMPRDRQRRVRDRD